MSVVVLATGKILPHYLDRFIDQLKAVDHKIASVWDDEKPEYVKRLAENGFIIISMDPTLPTAACPQSATIVNGVQLAKKLGHAYILRTRFDIVCNDMPKYLEVTRHLYEEKLTVLCGIHHYICDMIVSGPTDDMCRTYTWRTNADNKRNIEEYIIDNYVGRRLTHPAEVREAFNFALEECRFHGIEFIFFRPPEKGWANWGRIRSIPDMRLVSDYCTEYHARM